jgi:hypothetical protein
MPVIKNYYDFLNENANANDGIAKMRNTVIDILKKSSEKITSSNVSITKDGKKMKLSCQLTTDRKPRYNSTDKAPAQPAPATSTEPITFVFNCEGMNEPIASFDFKIASANDVQMTDMSDKSVLKFNKMNVKFMPDEIQQKIEKKYGKIA